MSSLSIPISVVLQKEAEFNFLLLLNISVLSPRENEQGAFADMRKGTVKLSLMPRKSNGASKSV